MLVKELIEILLVGVDGNKKVYVQVKGEFIEIEDLYQSEYTNDLVLVTGE
jgi:hypothetical protein